MTAITILMLAVAYLVGSISSAVLVCRLFGLPDPRTTGSNNPGTTNVYRLGGRFPALFVLACDVLKGTLPVYGSFLLGLHAYALGAIAIAACLGHIYPLFFGFKGGKAVATAFGCLLSVGYDLAALLIISWIIVVFITGYASLGAIVAVVLAPIFTWLLKPEYTLPVLMLTLLIIFRHKDNLYRLWRSQESKVWHKGKANE